jgi:hypothetical protein
MLRLIERPSSGCCLQKRHNFKNPGIVEMGMTKLNDVIIACVFSVTASIASAACDDGSTHEQLICLQREICPDPASEAERTACYRMITAALSGKEVPAAPNESIESSPAESSAASTMIGEPASATEEESAADVAVANESIESFPAESSAASTMIGERSSATVEESAADMAVANESIESSPAVSSAASTIIDRPASVAIQEPATDMQGKAESNEARADNERRFSFSNLFGRDDEADVSGWAKIVFVRAEMRGTELIVLDNGQVWVENVRNPYSQFKRRDRVRISGTNQLIRKDGAKTIVARVECGPSRPLKGQCKSLEKYLD